MLFYPWAEYSFNARRKQVSRETLATRDCDTEHGPMHSATHTHTHTHTHTNWPSTCFTLAPHEKIELNKKRLVDNSHYAAAPLPPPSSPFTLAQKKITNISKLCHGPWQWSPGAGIMEADSFHSPTVIPPSALDKPSIMMRYHRRRTCSHISPRRSPTMVTLHDTRFVECRWWTDGWTVKTVVTWRSSASMIPAPDL